MLLKTLILTSLLSSSVFAQTVYDLESFYASHKNRIFKSAPLEFKHEVATTDKEYEIPYSQAKGKIDGKFYNVEIKNNSIFINKIKFKAKSDMFTLVGDRFYISKNLACLNAYYLSSNGAAQRIVPVFFLDLKKTKLQKDSIRTLPSYFGSCENIRMGKNGKITFYEVSPFYDKHDDEIGLYFDEHYIDDNGKHIKTGKRVKGTYLKKGISDKFTIK